MLCKLGLVGAASDWVWGPRVRGDGSSSVRHGCLAPENAEVQIARKVLSAVLVWHAVVPPSIQSYQNGSQPLSPAPQIFGNPRKQWMALQQVTLTRAPIFKCDWRLTPDMPSLSL
ncbi:uncharacterized protein LOC106965662 isoform X1 [Acinonyx jubatus]|uniref:Uncharacterized protein LOC106965662 isoform X1 n=1 Tax=Acinonyx jubatus TaxID=32536 RepID=A0ABM3QD26_ACIJB|nr:uncharacterized protein LOC106965662 isoform X1 [Acinonyx jubatus]XP_053081830.1 uncharacterized protein LOC106965662 isoform X1 [Acinonyx jubatus]